MPPPTPRKFAEKIALHTQKGVEEAAIFSKIMAECAAMTGALKVGKIWYQLVGQWIDIQW